jgi:hypothetical protein
MMEGADTDRAAVYAAELVAFDGTDLEVPLGHEAIERRLREVIAGEWWPGGHVEVQAARSDARSSSARCSAHGESPSVVIRMAASQTTLATAAHELAHALAGVDRGHGAAFRRAHLDVIAVLSNADSTDRRADLHVEQLADAYRSVGLTLGDREWPAPPASHSGPIAL